jgi:hypothetical protein
MKGWKKEVHVETTYESKYGRLWFHTRSSTWACCTPITEIWVNGFKTRFDAARYLRELWPEEQKMVLLDAVREQYVKKAGKIAANYGAHI